MQYNTGSEEEETEIRNTSRIEDKIEAALLRARRIFFSQVVDMQSAKDAIRKLWYLEIVHPGKPILFVINSPGGSIDAGFAIWDQVKMISSPVTTLITGLAASMGSVLALCAASRRRFITPNARVMVHQPRIGGVVQGQATDLEIQAKEILKTRDILVDLYVAATGKSRDLVEKALDRDKWLSAKEAIEFGLVDRIVHSYQDIHST